MAIVIITALSIRLIRLDRHRCRGRKNWVEELKKWVSLNLKWVKNCVSLNLPFNHDVKRRQSKLALFLVSADLKSITKAYQVE